MTEIWNGESQEQSDIPQVYEKMLSKPDWQSQFGYLCGKTPNDCFSNGCPKNCKKHCYDCAKGVAGLDQADPVRTIYTRSGTGVEPIITMGNEPDEDTNFKNLIQEIKNGLDANQALIAGVFKQCYINITVGNPNKATHHWIVVVGMKIEGNTGTLYYHDPAPIDSISGSMQTLNIDFVNKKISGTSKYLKDIYNDEEQAKYILTDIKVKQEHHVAKK